jgi:lipopolysaccharide export system permease protein
MYILNRYLLLQFVQIFSICFVSLIGLYIVIDAFGHLDHFSSYAEQHGNLFKVMVEYYSYHSLAFFDKTSGILAMISAIFTVAWLGRNQELTAFMAAGISKFRVLKPVLVATVVISFVAAANREWVLPQVRDQINRDTKDLGKSADRKLEPRLDAQNRILIGGDRVMLDKQWIGNPSFVLPLELARYGRQLAAAVAVYKPADSGHPAGFLLTQLKTPPASQICRMPSLSLGDRSHSP